MSLTCQVLQQENLTIWVDERKCSEPFALTCGSCGEPLLPNLSQADADGCLWICINPDCPELCAGELETGDLAEGGVPEALAARLVRLVDYYEDTIEELRAQCGGEGEEGADAGGGGAAAPPPAGSRERAQADLASLRRQVRELRRRSAAPPATPPPTPRSASSASTPGCRGCSPRASSDLSPSSTAALTFQSRH